MEINLLLLYGLQLSNPTHPIIKKVRLGGKPDSNKTFIFISQFHLLTLLKNKF